LPVLKAALLKRYELTEEGFRKKFRQCKPEKGETVFQFKIEQIFQEMDRTIGYQKEDAPKAKQDLECCSAGIAVIEENDVSDEEGNVDLLKIDYVNDEEYLDKVKIGPDINEEQRKQVQKLLMKYEDIFTGEPGSTNLVNHKIELTTTQPIRQRPYAIPYAKKQAVKEEVEKMLQMGIIEPSNSAYNSPIVLVRKKDGTIRFCIDFRRLDNEDRRFDNEPMGNVEGILARLDHNEYYSKFDMTKGYWQIPMEQDSKEMTAFSTDDGCYQFCKMPFGLVNSGATFNRMRKMLDQAKDTEHYIDDVLCHTKTWEEHLAVLEDLFSRIRRAGLTVKPSKCKVAQQTLEVLGKGTISLEQEKIQKVKDAKPPQTKKQ
ncbi:hypothetical protein QZH41_009486, partial [Actinostola sp. cb2023]